jgi:PAS domain S-box-containing protein
MKTRKVKILAIDDNIVNLISIKELIRETFPEAVFFSETSGEKGIELASIEYPDVILLDILMPEMDGFEVCTKLKSDKILSDIPIVFITSLGGDKESRMRALECGGEAFLSKPVDQIELIAQIRAMVKIKNANLVKRNEKKHLEKLVDKRTRELKKELGIHAITEAELREKEVQYRNLADSGMALIWTSGYDKLRNYFNEPWLKFTGKTSVTELYTEWERSIHPDDFENRRQVYETAFDKREKFDLEYRMRNAVGEYIWIRDLGTPNYNRKGKFIGYIGHCFDISEQKKTELAIIKAKEKAEESDRLKSAFLANMSHEIRTPMNSILGFAGLLKDSDNTIEEHELFIDTIEKSGARMLFMINDIIDISKIESGQMDISISATNINEQIEEVHTFLANNATEKGLEIYFYNTLNDKDAIIETDNEKLYSILTNLVKNAIKFTRKGVIEFGYKLKDNYLEFFVKDTGVGISQEQKKIIFKRFRQGSESFSRNFEGSGLGLTISKAYVEMLGGKIWVESDPDGISHWRQLKKQVYTYLQ